MQVHDIIVAEYLVKIIMKGEYNNNTKAKEKEPVTESSNEVADYGGKQKQPFSIHLKETRF